VQPPPLALRREAGEGRTGIGAAHQDLAAVLRISPASSSSSFAVCFCTACSSVALLWDLTRLVATTTLPPPPPTSHSAG
jgi:hypothetical protein